MRSTLTEIAVLAAEPGSIVWDGSLKHFGLRVADHRNLLVTGPCGVGKSWLSCALAQKACRDGYTVHYARVPRLPSSRGFSETASLRARIRSSDGISWTSLSGRRKATSTSHLG